MNPCAGSLLAADEGGAGYRGSISTASFVLVRLAAHEIVIITSGHPSHDRLWPGQGKRCKRPKKLDDFSPPPASHQASPRITAL